MTIQGLYSLEELEKLISENALVVIDFFSTWCGPCKVIAPKFANLANQHTNIVFANLDVDAVPDAAAKYNISAMPTFLYFKNGQRVDEVVGANIANITAKVEALAT